MAIRKPKTGWLHAHETEQTQEREAVNRGGGEPGGFYWTYSLINAQTHGPMGSQSSGERYTLVTVYDPFVAELLRRFTSCVLCLIAGPDGAVMDQRPQRPQAADPPYPGPSPPTQWVLRAYHMYTAAQHTGDPRPVACSGRRALWTRCFSQAAFFQMKRLLDAEFVGR